MSSPCDEAQDDRRSGLAETQSWSQVEFTWKSNPPKELATQTAGMAAACPLQDAVIRCFTPRIKIP